MLLFAAVLSRRDGDGSWIDDVWVGRDAREEHRKLDGVRVFRVTPEGRHRVLVADDITASKGLLSAAAQRLAGCNEWQPITSFADDRSAGKPNAFSCLYPRTDADSLLTAFNDEAQAAMALAFNVSSGSCRHLTMTERAGPPVHGLLDALHALLPARLVGRAETPRRAWVLALHSALTPDLFHSDGCERIAREPGTDFFTVLSYPNDASWQRDWGGELLIAPSVCISSHERKSQSQQRYPAGDASGAVLRVTPRPGRVVVFSGQLLHRSTPPTQAKPASASLPALAAGVTHLGRRYEVPAEARWRYSSVMQVLCRNNAYFGPFDEEEAEEGPPAHAHAGRDEGGAAGAAAAAAEALDARTLFRAVAFAAAVVLFFDRVRG